MQEVKILSYTDINTLEEAINNLLANGWQLRGSLNINIQESSIVTGGNILYTQFMYKPTEKIPKRTMMGAS
jgi:hypothetical protein